MNLGKEVFRKNLFDEGMKEGAVSGPKNLLQDVNQKEPDNQADKFGSCCACIKLRSGQRPGYCGQQGRFRPVDQGNMAGP